MPKSPYDDIVREHYDSVAKNEGLEPSSTMVDDVIRKKETQIILDVIGDYTKYSDRAGETREIVDVGCGNGYTL